MHRTLAMLLFVAAASVGAQQAAYSGLGAGSVPPELVAKYAAPPLDPVVMRSIQAMLDLRAPGLGIVAPDGRQLYFSWRITGSSQVFRLDRPKGFPIQMTGGEDTTAIRAITPDGHWLVLSRDIGGQENPGIYLQPADGGPLKKVFHADRVQAFFDFVTDDGRELYFRANDRAPDSYAVYKYDLASGATSLVFGEKGLWDIADYRGRGSELRLLLVKLTGSTSREYAEYVPATKTLTPLLGAGEVVEYQARYAAQPGELLVITNKFTDFRRLYRWKMGGGSSAADFREVLAPAGMDVARFSIDEARRHIYAATNDGGYARLVVLDAQSFARIALPLPRDAEQVYAGEATRDGRYVTIGVATAKAPRTSYVFDWTTRTLTQWVVPAAPEVDLQSFVPARLMTYPARDGTKIPMFVRFPKGCAPDENRTADPCPVIVEFHGGPEGQATPGFSPIDQAYVDAGFILVEPNVRGSDGYGKTWLDADNGPKRLDVIGDIDDAGKWIRANWGRNGKAPKIGVMGGSYGGYAALIAMTMFAGTYDAGASVVGISNLETFLRNTAPYRRILRTTEYGDPDRDAEALRKLSPVTYLDRVNAPLLLIQGVNDPRVPAGEAIQIHDLLERRGVSAPLILFPDEGHGAAKRSNAALQYGHMLKFFETNLKNNGKG
jgi:protease II